MSCWPKSTQFIGARTGGGQADRLPPPVPSGCRASPLQLEAPLGQPLPLVVLHLVDADDLVRRVAVLVERERPDDALVVLEVRHPRADLRAVGAHGADRVD